MVNLFPYNPIDNSNVINNGSVNVVLCGLPVRDKINDKIYGWQNDKYFIDWFRRLIGVVELKLIKQGIFILWIEKIDIDLLNIINSSEFNILDQYVLKGKKGLVNIFIMSRDTKNEIKTILKSYQNDSGIQSKDLNKLLGICSNGGGYWSLYTGDNIRLKVPSLEHWEKLQEVFEMDINYEDIVSSYIEKEDKILNVEYGSIDFYRILLGMSNNVKMVWDIFSGVGNGIRLYEKEGYNYIGFEYNRKKYFKALLNLGETIDVKHL